MTVPVVRRLMASEPFASMDATRFSKTCPLDGILLNDSRVVRYSPGDLVVREGDYGNSAFLVLEGTVRVVLTALPAKLLGRPPARRKSVLQTMLRQALPRYYPEVRMYGTVQLDDDLGRRGGGEQTRIFLQDVPRVLLNHQTIGLREGEIFGELAALSRTARTATVFAETESELLEIRWQGLREFMRRDPALKSRIDALYRQNSLESHLRESPLLRKLSNDAIQRVADATEFACFGDFEWSREFRESLKQEVSQRIHAEPLMAAEGEGASSLVMIRAGFARLSRKYDHGHRTLAYLGKGQLFGLAEIAAGWRNREVGLRNSLRAVGYVDALRIPREVVEDEILPTLSTAELKRIAGGLADSAIAPSRAATPQPRTARQTGWLEFLLDRRLNNATQAMLIDLDRCTRCDDCVRACAATHDENPRFMRQGPRYGNYMIANACLHCVDPVCMIGCPTGAIGRAADSGNVLINDLTCIGCSTCANSCPYANIRMVETRYPDGPLILDEHHQPIVKATKCDLCQGQWGGPACQRACPHDALFRVDLTDADQVAKWMER